MTRTKRELAYRAAGALILAAAVVPWAATGTAVAGGTEGNVTKCNPNDPTGEGQKPANLPGQTIPKSDITYTVTGGGKYVNITAVASKWTVTGIVVKAGNGYETYTADELGSLPWEGLRGPGIKQQNGTWKHQQISHWFVCGTPKGTPTPCPTVTVTKTVPGPTQTVTKTQAGPTQTVTETETVGGPTETVTETVTEAGPTQTVKVTETLTITPDPVTHTQTVTEAGPTSTETVTKEVTITPDPIVTTVKVTETVAGPTETVTEAGPTETVTETITQTAPTETVTETAPTETVTESAPTETATETATQTVLVSQTSSVQAGTDDPTSSSTDVAVLGTKAPGTSSGDVLAETGADGMTQKLVLSGALLMIGFALFAAPELLGAARTTMGRRH